MSLMKNLPDDYAYHSVTQEQRFTAMIRFTTHVESKRKLTPATIYVIRGAHGCLLSHQTATELDLISIDTSSIASVNISTPTASTNNLMTYSSDILISLLVLAR